jgi:hypothetical protein
MAERYSQLLSEIMDREKQRNEMLLDSEYAEFALSEESVVEEALRAFDSAMAKQLELKIMGKS